MYKSSILIAALVTGACASENPFALEKNIQKIEQEESTLLQALAKEQKRVEREEDKLLEESISESKISDVNPKENKVPAETEIVQEPELQEIKKEEKESKPEEVASSAAKQKEPLVILANETFEKIQEEEVKEKSSVEKISKNPEEEAVKEIEISKSEEPLTIREVTGKPEIGTANKSVVTKTQPSVEKKIEEVDAEIKKLEEKLEESKAKPAIADKVYVQSNAEANGSAERNTTFEQELQEAIRSVQE